MSFWKGKNKKKKKRVYKSFIISNCPKEVSSTYNKTNKLWMYRLYPQIEYNYYSLSLNVLFMQSPIEMQQDIMQYSDSALICCQLLEIILA